MISESHSIRQKTLNYWNENIIDSIRFFCNDKDKARIDIEVTVPKNVHATNIYPRLLFWSQRALISLSVGTFGYFWWYTPKHREKFYEKIIDLENEAELRVKREPPLKIDWPNRAIQNEDLLRILMCLALLPKKPTDPDWTAFTNYLMALALISKTDIHLGFQPGIFSEFMKCLVLLAKRFENWDTAKHPTVLLKKVIAENYPTFDETDRYEEICNSLFDGRQSKIAIQMDDFIKLKMIIDGYILKHFKVQFKMLEEEKKKCDEDNISL